MGRASKTRREQMYQGLTLNSDHSSDFHSAFNFPPSARDYSIGPDAEPLASHSLPRFPRCALCPFTFPIPAILFLVNSHRERAHSSSFTSLLAHPLHPIPPLGCFFRGKPRPRFRPVSFSHLFSHRFGLCPALRRKEAETQKGDWTTQKGNANTDHLVGVGKL